MAQSDRAVVLGARENGSPQYRSQNHGRDCRESFARHRLLERAPQTISMEESNLIIAILMDHTTIYYLKLSTVDATASAAKYKPSPKTVCVVRLLMELKTGFGVLEEAIPAPSAGCRMNSGETTVTIPTMSAGRKVGFRA